MKRLVLTLLSLVLALAGLSTVVPAPTARAVATDLTSGTVSWGIKASWRSYIGAANTITGDGATVTGVTGNVPDGFDFPVLSGSYDDQSRTTVLHLGGWVRFRAYRNDSGSYALDSTFKDLEVRIGPEAQEIRGTYVGYTRDDPGGALHEDVDVVLATLDVAGAAGTSFEAGHTAWDAIPSQGGAGQTLYAPGTTFDPVSIEYDGPGGLPDLAERFDQPGVPVLTEGARWSSGSTVSGGNNAQRALEVSARGDVVYAIQFDAAHGAQNLVFTALDAQDLTPVGTPYTQVMTATGNTGRFLRTALDPETDTLFYVTAKDGAAQDEVTLRTLRFDRLSGAFVPGVVGVIATTASPAVGNLVWHDAAGELGVLVSTAPTATEEEPYRLVRVHPSGEGWDVSRSPVRWPESGDFPGGWHLSRLTAASTSNGMSATLAPFGDDSYVLATSTTSIRVDGVDRYAPAFRLRPTGDGAVEVSGIAGTTARPFDETGTVSYGWTAASAGPDGSAYLHGLNQRLDDYQRVDLVDGAAVARPAVEGEPIPLYLEYGILTSRTAEMLAYDAERNLLWAGDIADPEGRTLKLVDDSGTLAGYRVAEFTGTGGGAMVIETGVDGSLYVPVQSNTAPREFGYRRMVFEGIAPTVTTQPEDVSVELARDEASREVAVTAAIDADLGGDLQWQARGPGEARFKDVAGATSATLRVAATPTAGGSTYRLKVTNDAGTVVSEEAALAVTYAPRFVLDARSQSVTEGADATFLAHAQAGPALTSVVWQRRVGGYWQTIPEDDDNVVVATAEGVSSLTVVDANVDQSGSLFRAKAVNPVGTTYSAAAKLTVTPKRAVPAAGLALDGVTLDWSGSEELQSAPPFGGSNYLSAGVSDGDQTSYRAAAGGVTVVHRTADGTEAPATWATRAAPVAGGVEQLVRLADGHAELAADGSGTVRWQGTFSVNFYGGLVPFWLSAPELVVAADGTGTLTADVDGYGSSMADPQQRTPLDAVADVPIATFADVEIDPAGAVTVVPDYAGVAVDLPADATPQNRTVAGWGAWPQGFVDVHLATGLESYWYSSGGAADAKKAPAPFVVDFTDAEEVAAAPEPAPGPGTSGEQPATVTPVVTLTVGKARVGRKATARVSVALPAGAAYSGQVVVRSGNRVLAARRVVALGSGDPVTLTLGKRVIRRLGVGRHFLTATAAAGTPTAAASSEVVVLRVRKARR
ncbi:HtaA domain-containing protein [Nocardioides nitrophenolicus]|uniref:HtaA domain-containing protein n=1 Tax=Nocardioides nitrophenolicus TaxID=60489 RepID=UPI001958C37F|nr:HtaA domain-containing protein [Nocardioides nitrophenolicus]MBM7519165.1 hypothetical protein [Nocardioides nitrophenolicus]